MTRCSLLVLLVACGSPASAPQAPQPPQAPPPATPAPAHELTHHTGHHGFDDAERWAKIFDDPSRDAWQQPERVLGYLALAPGMTVADIGAGTGYFEARLAKAVGPTGQVLALDTAPDMVRYMTERAAKEGTPNVKARVIAPDDPGLEASSVDRILIVNTWHHIGDRASYAKKLRAALKPKGFVAIVDFTMETTKGPPPAHRLKAEVVRDELEQAGLITATINELPDQYVVTGSLK